MSRGSREGAFVAELELMRECKLVDLFREHALGDRLEASGVCVRDAALYVVFDNMPIVVRAPADLDPIGPGRTVFRPDDRETGYEDIAYDTASGRFLALVESEAGDDGVFRPRIDEYDESFRLVQSATLPLELTHANKGLEGLTVRQLDGATYAVTLCEGNHCTGGKKGRTPGGGRLPVFERTGDGWSRVTTYELPHPLPFEDYSAVDVREGRAAVLSQSSGSVWVCEIDEQGRQLVGEGSLYDFPRTRKGKPLYCNAEGLAWIGPDELVIASDRSKKDDPSSCARKQMALHVFRVR
jgi:hypothetical protein